MRVVFAGIVRGLSSRVLGVVAALTLILSTSLVAISDAEAQFPEPPTAVAASDGSSINHVQVTWVAPTGGEAVQSYKIFRSASNLFCSGTVVATIPSSNTQYLDVTATPSTIYYYSVRSIAANTLESNCSNTDAGFRADQPPPLPPVNLTATGNLLDKIALAWQIPAGGQPINGIQIFRSTQQTVCSGSALTSLNTAATAFNDTTAVPGQVYYYSLKSSGPTGLSACSDVPVQGFRLEPPPPLPPVSVNASDGTFTNKVQVDWQIPTGSTTITNYRLHRATVPALCNSLLMDGIAANSSQSNDTSAIPGRLYYYSMDSFGPYGLSTCSNVNSGYARVSPPINLVATDGTFPDKVELTFAPPAAGGDISGYEIYRSTTPGSACAGSPVVANQSSSVFKYTDTSVTPGALYYYSMKTLSPTGPSDCSVVESGFPRIGSPTSVSATDGTFTDKVDVIWTPPASVSNLIGYTLYRDLTPVACQTVRVSGIGAGTTNFSDTAVIPGTQYYYSVRALSASGESVCSPVDPGYAKISPPQNVSATDGTFPDKVVVTWIPPAGSGNVTSYDLYKSPVAAACTTLLAGGLSSGTTTFSDTAVTPGTLYYYSIKAVSPTGASACSPVDSGFAKAPIPICSDGLDNDADGLIDLQDPGCKGDPNRNDEKNPDGPACDDGIDNDGDGKIDFRVDGQGDPGCSGPTDPAEDDAGAPLLSPAYIKYNTYLGQWNYAELINQSDRSKNVDVTVFNLYGQPMITRTYVVAARNEVDVDVNALIAFACDVLKSGCADFVDLSKTQPAQNGIGRPDGVVDTYGLVKLVFDDSDPDERLLGRMSFYRPDSTGQTFSFAFAREFKNPLRGPAYSTSNTYDPQGQGNLVPNWAEILNLSDEPHPYTVNVYTQSGVLKYTRTVTVGPLGEFDVQAGHEFRGPNGKVEEGVFLVEVVPGDISAPYSFSVSRYSSNNAGADQSSYNFAFSIEASTGTTEAIYAPISNGLVNVSALDPRVSLTNWVEVVNVSNRKAQFLISFRRADGTLISETANELAPKSQLHFNASALLPKGSNGIVEIHGDGAIISQSLSYVHGPLNELQTGFVSMARAAGRAEQGGSINTFLQMQNILNVFSTAGSPSTAQYAITSFSGQSFSGQVSLGGFGASSVELSKNSSLNFPENAYGALIIDTGSGSPALSEMRRVRVQNGAVDFVMPTAIK